MSYTQRLRITVPASLYDVACSIARALDPDVGGAASWGPRIRTQDDGTEYVPDFYTCDTPCTEEFHAQAHAMLTDPALLHAAVTADYAARWADLTPPTLAECEAFVAACELS